MKFAANISTMFKEVELCDRFNEAHAYNFKAVEAQFIYDDFPLTVILEARNAVPLDFVLMNSPYKPGELFPKGNHDSSDPSLAAALQYASGSKSMNRIQHRSAEEANIVDPFGLACLPGHGEDFGNSIVGCMRICDLLKCRKLHVLAGMTPPGELYQTCEETYIHNLKWAVKELQEYQVVAVIEPLCHETKPGYFLNSFEQAVKYIEEINSDYLKLLLDVYHLHKIENDVEAGLKKYLPYAGHIQISQSPGRIDPFQNGDIDYARVFEIIKESSYNGHVGLEYTPVDEVPDFTWMENYAD